MLKFVHISKTGGTSVINEAKEHDILWGEHDPDLHTWFLLPDISNVYQVHWKMIMAAYFLCRGYIGTLDHIPLHMIGDKQYYESLLRKNVYFAIVRNPYNRCISEYYCSNQGPSWNGDVRHMNQFIQRMIKYKFTSAHWTPASSYIYDGQRKIVEHVLKYENLATEFPALMAKYNLPLTMSKRENSGRKRSVKYTMDDLTPDTRRLIEEVYADDFRNFGYSKLN